MAGVEAALGVPVVFILAIRFIMSVILQTQNQNADSLLKGLIQGLLLYHAVLSASQAIAIALALGIGGRLIGDFITQWDSWKMASTLLGIAFGVLLADVVSFLYDDKDWSAFSVSSITRTREKSHRHRSHRRVSEPRKIEEIPAVYGEVSSLESTPRLGDDKELSDIEKDVARLRAKALHAAGQRRRFREERKWALSQGNIARAFQLRWQVKKYHALANSFTKEADEKLLQADRVKRAESATTSSFQKASRSTPQIPSAPFVQVVVEGGRDAESSDSADEQLPSKEHARRISQTYRTAKETIRTRSGVNIDSRG
ncbi:hypothetical protein M422DRAFT_27996 [Sphaerobolus stellatus SS14]|nr:hypothetical protein M422DRAFT_27996 [Sphaerobolus stellatus SS14]